MLEINNILPYLPYSLKVIMEGKKCNIAWISKKNISVIRPDGIGEIKRVKWERAHFNIQPILQPMSREVLHSIFNVFEDFEIIYFNDVAIKIQFKIMGEYIDTWIKTSGTFNNCPKYIIDLFNKNLVDYQGLIDKKLAVNINNIKL